MTKIKYKINKIFSGILFFLFRFIMITLVVRLYNIRYSQTIQQIFFIFSYCFYISNIYIPEGFPGDYNNGYIPLQDGIVFYTSLSLNYSVQCSSEHDYHLLLPAQRKNIFSFFSSSVLIYCFQNSTKALFNFPISAS